MEFNSVSVFQTLAERTRGQVKPFAFRVPDEDIFLSGSLFPYATAFFHGGALRLQQQVMIARVRRNVEIIRISMQQHEPVDEPLIFVVNICEQPLVAVFVFSVKNQKNLAIFNQLPIVVSGRIPKGLCGVLFVKDFRCIDADISQMAAGPQHDGIAVDNMLNIRAILSKCTQRAPQQRTAHDKND
jgi:hypothetical protein